MFQFTNSQPATFFQFVIRKTSYAGGYALYRAYPADGAGQQFSPALGHRDTLTYTLSGPTNALLSSNGLFTWTPTEAQAPGLYTITVEVTDTNAAAVNTNQLSATNSFSVQVLGADLPPVLAPITNCVVNDLAALVLTASATDPDVGDVLTFSLGAGAPLGAAINPQTGVFTWTPAARQAPGRYSVTITVTDNGVPGLATSCWFEVQVEPPPVLGLTLTSGQPWLIWNSTVGRKYQAQYKSLLGDSPWTNLGAAIVATNNTATLVDPTFKGATSRIYRVMLLP